METDRIGKSIHKQKLAEADKPMLWYKVVVFVIIPLSMLLTLALLFFAASPTVRGGVLYEEPWLDKIFSVGMLTYCVSLLFVLFELGWHLYIFSRRANVYLVVVLVLLVISFGSWKTVFYPVFDKTVFYSRIALAIISAIYLKKRWYMFDSIRPRTAVPRVAERGNLLMNNIDEIMEMSDWNNSEEIRQKGVELAKGIKYINLFILPMYPGKSVWENCAKILVDRSDEELKPYLFRLLEWLEDLTWPGAMIILDRLKNYSETSRLSSNVNKCVKLAIATSDHMWLVHIAELLDNEKLKAALPEGTREVLQKYYHDWD